MADFEKKLDKNAHNDELSVTSHNKSKISDKESVFDVLFRDRALSNFSHHMSDIHRLDAPMKANKAPSSNATFTASMTNLMDLFEIKKIYLNDGLLLKSSEYFLEPEEHEGVPFPVSIRVEDLKNLISPEEILNIFQNSVLVILKGATSLVHIKTYPSRSYYGIRAMLKIQEVYEVQCLIGVTTDPTFTHEIYHDYQLRDLTFSFIQRIRIA